MFSSDGNILTLTICWIFYLVTIISEQINHRTSVNTAFQIVLEQIFTLMMKEKSEYSNWIILITHSYSLTFSNHWKSCSGSQWIWSLSRETGHEAWKYTLDNTPVHHRLHAHTHLQTHSHLGAIYISQATYCHVFEWWEETGDPRGNLQGHGENVHKMSKQTLTKAQDQTRGPRASASPCHHIHIKAQ